VNVLILVVEVLR